MREWKTIRDFKEILFEEYNGIAKITINRPQILSEQKIRKDKTFYV